VSCADTDSSRTRADALVEHLFRHASGRMVAALTRLFGTKNLELALGEMHLRLGEPRQAYRHFERALVLASSPAERRLLQEKLAACRGL